MLNILPWVAGIVAATMIVGMALVRTTSVSADRYHLAGEMPQVGDYATGDGFTAVRQVEDTSAALARLDGIMAGTARTVRLAGSIEERHVSYVTRSAFWRFPDVTNAWIDGDRIAVRAHLVIGKGDFGTNRHRIENWLSEAGLGASA